MLFRSDHDLEPAVMDRAVFGLSKFYAVYFLAIDWCGNNAILAGSCEK